MNILSIFAQSPFNPIREQLKLVSQGVELLPVFLETLYQADWQKATSLQQQLTDINQQACYLKQQVLLQIPTQVFQPLEDATLFGLLNEQQTILAIVKEVTHILLARKMKLTEELLYNLVGFSHVCLKAMETAIHLVNELDHLVAKENTATQKMFVFECMLSLDALVTDAQQIHADIMHDIFSIEKNICPLEAGFLYKILDEIKHIMTNLQSVGYRLQLIVC